MGIFLCVSLVILGVYVGMNKALFPVYPVVTPGAETSASYAQYYPPYRLEEQVNAEIARDVLSGRLWAEGSPSRQYPAGTGIVAAPFTAIWGQRGAYIANAVLLWAAAIAFFFLMTELVDIPIAAAATVALAFATPNLFYAASAFSGPAGQLILLIALVLLVRGMVSRYERILYAVSGFLAGSLLFFQPVMALTVLVFVLIIMYDNDHWWPLDRATVSMLGGGAAAMILYAAVNAVYYGSPLGELTARVQRPAELAVMGGVGENMIARLWRILFNGPQGLVCVMPVVMLVPLGLIQMWRNDLKTVTLAIGGVAGLGIIAAAVGTAPVTGQGVGSLLLVPIIPFLVAPLGFVWMAQTGERVWLAVALALSLYMCGFGWWAGQTGGSFLIGALHDPAAEAIILNRKGLLERPVFRSGEEIAAANAAAVEQGDIRGWLRTLQPEALPDIEGFERPYFETMHRMVRTGQADPRDFIETVDPDHGVRPALPQLE